MPLWRLSPAADPDDPRWLDHPIWREVVVRAEGAAEARLAASTLEIDPSAPPSGNEWPSRRSAFDDEKLYWVEQMSEPDPGGSAAVIRAQQLDRSPQ